ncbi:MAG TPA: DUF2306 domain-containing protein [Caulobacter sp.]|nr:DUF2306 domain-containing protein [Caulobacter sp.]
MNTLAIPRPKSVQNPARLADQGLVAAGGFWLLVTLLGQWAFFSYIAAFYGPAMATGQYEAWDALSALGAKAYVPGDDAGNRTFGFHALAAGIIALGGALQLVPQVRKRWPTFHRWNGRLFLVTVIGLSLSGFYLVWVRGPAPDRFSEFSTTFNGVLILSFAALAWRTAVARKIVQHRRWAIRLYLVSNGQWFLRIGLFSYFVVSMGLGRKPSFGDPFLSVWVWGCYLVPIAIAEVYFQARDRGGATARWAAAGLIGLLTLLMAVGIVVFGVFSMGILSGKAPSMG